MDCDFIADAYFKSAPESATSTAPRERQARQPRQAPQNGSIAIGQQWPFPDRRSPPPLPAPAPDGGGGYYPQPAAAPA